MTKTDAAFEQALTDAGITADQRKLLEREMPIYKTFFTLGAKAALASETSRRVAVLLGGSGT